ncbi:MAG: serine/threonine-protein kinase [Isosphaeraceae bacterium]
MSVAWSLGLRPSAEEFLARHPEVRTDPLAATRVIYEEVCLREGIGQRPNPEELLDRFPQWGDQLRMLLECHQIVTPEALADGLPEVGEVLGEYTLRMVLGHGTRGRVFLATQGSLGDRPVVLKVTPRRGGEHLSLARLQHPHVVPLYACHEFPERDLRALCMPYLGGATLDRVVDRIRGRSPTGLSGATFLDVLDEARTEFIELPAWSATRQFLARATYPRAVCWLGACLAEALHYAHVRGVLHLDLKPSNILLADDGQPMLLDFHLARGPLDPGDPPADRLGGTPAYAAIEHRRAMLAVKEGRPVPERVDGRSDLFSLGVVLYEALAGEPPADETSAIAASLVRANATVPLGLAEILQHCLRPHAADRYRDAAALAADLRGHLGHLPMQGSPGRARFVRWRPRWPGRRA